MENEKRVRRLAEACVLLPSFFRSPFSFFLPVALAAVEAEVADAAGRDGEAGDLPFGVAGEGVVVVVVGEGVGDGGVEGAVLELATTQGQGVVVEDEGIGH